jgi:hypothetical protein
MTGIYGLVTFIVLSTETCLNGSALVILEVAFEIDSS